MRWWISICSGLMACAAAFAGPVDFGMEQLRAALDERSLKLFVETELNLDPPGAFRIVPIRTGVRVSGGDLRGLMYGLLETANQVRSTGKVKAATGKPAMQLRGVRMTPSDADLATPGFFAGDRWREHFRLLARGRITSLTLVLPAAAAELDRVQFLSHTANEYGIDFILGLRGTFAGLYPRLRRLLDECVLLRGIEAEIGDEPAGAYQESVIRAIKESGRRVILDLHGAARRPDVLRAAVSAGVALRVAPSSGEPAGFEAHALVRDAAAAESQDSIRRRVAGLADGRNVGFEVDARGPDLRPYESLLGFWGRFGYEVGPASVGAGGK